MPTPLYPSPELVKKAADPELRDLVERQADAYRVRLEAAGFAVDSTGVRALVDRLAVEEGRIETAFACLSIVLNESNPEVHAPLAVECLAALPAVLPIVERLAELEKDAHRRAVLEVLLDAARAGARAHAIRRDVVLLPASPHLN